MAPVVTTTVQPATEPVTKEQLKAFSRVVSDLEDQLLDTLIRSARRECETYMKRSLITQTKVLTVKALGTSIDLPLGPVQAVTAVEYLDADDGTYKPIDSDVYKLSHMNRFTSEVRIVAGIDANVDRDSEEAYRVTYTAGYGDAGSDVPADVQVGILIAAHNIYENRGDKPTPKLALDLWDGERKAHIG